MSPMQSDQNMITTSVLQFQARLALKQKLLNRQGFRG